MSARYDPKEHIQHLEVAPRVESILDQREITVQTYQTSIAFDYDAINAGLERSWLTPQLRFGLFARRHVSSRDELHAVLGLQDDISIRAYDYDERRPLWYSWRNVVVDTVSIRYFKNDQGLLRFTTTGGGQRITEDKLQEFNSAFLGIPKDAVSKLQFDLDKLRDLCFNRFADRLLMLKFANPSAIGYQSIDQTSFKSRDYIDPNVERLREVRADSQVTVEAFDSDVEVRSDTLASIAKVRFEIRGLSGSLRLRFPKLSYKALPDAPDEQARIFYQLVDTTVMSILDSDYYAHQRWSLDDLKLDLGMFPDLVDLAPFRDVLTMQEARAQFIAALDLGAPWQDWLPHLRAIDELSASDVIKDHVASLVAELVKRDPGMSGRLLATCQRDPKLRRIGAVTAIALAGELQASAAEQRAATEEVLLSWFIDHEQDAWDVDPASGTISVRQLLWRVDDLAIEVLPTVLWKLVGVIHARLLGTIDDATTLLRKYQWCMAATKELSSNHSRSPAALRLVSSGRVPKTVAAATRVLRTAVADLRALDDVVLDQFGLPLWPCLRALRVGPGIVLTNDGIGSALALTLVPTANKGESAAKAIDLAPGETVSLPGPGDGTSLNITFEKFGRQRLAILEIGAGVDDVSNVRKLPVALNRRRIEAQRKCREQIDKAGLVIGGNPAVLRLFEDIQHANAIDGAVAVLILGEPGVGKTHVAKLLHDSSSRAAKPYKEVNAGGSGGDVNIQKGEWIGYGKGHGIAGVDPKGRAGHLVEVDGGTLFVDEFVTFSQELQVIFLSVLEKRGVQKVGGETVTPDVRCVFATNADIDEAKENGKMRGDLLDRIQIRMVIPPLRERRGDIAALTKHFAADGVSFDDQCLLALLRHDWPGNIRDLQQKVKGAVARANTASANVVRLEHVELPDQVVSAIQALKDEEARRELWTTADRLAREEGFEPGAGLQKRAGEILGVQEAQASKMYTALGLAQVG